MDFDTMLGKAELPETTVRLCLAGNLAAEHERLNGELEQLIKKPVTKFSGDGRGELATRIKQLEEQMAESTYPFRLRALPRPAWRSFVAEYPPRKTPSGEVEEADARLGVNTETFWEALVRRCLIDPEPTDERWSVLLEKLTDNQFSKLADGAWSVNRRDVDVPFSSAVWALNQSSESE
jgi:hypothetical protein